MGAATAASARPPAGRRAVRREVLGEWGVSPESFVLSDGSGLSRYNYVTASGLTTILERMYRDDRHREPFAATLPVAGKDGTIATRMRAHARGKERARQDRLDRQRPIALRVRAHADGEQLVFAILANDFVAPAATITWMADLASRSWRTSPADRHAGEPAAWTAASGPSSLKQCRMPTGRAVIATPRRVRARAP
jgi:D-alanyl-D-alanine carboxypeptidase